ncbi:MAG: WD40 repeat domain-containing protein [Chloroflexi bacterium CFX4]|nr:WD40 repeat domain-containing protein [Chloroflexi bacterium CFX4]MDL1922288.1 WD40 repeat domain-containing protein [Chloroflexi bacterium CFX3]
MRRMLLVVILLCVPLASLSAFVRAVSLQAEGEDYACLRAFSEDTSGVTHLINVFSGDQIAERQRYANPHNGILRSALGNVHSPDGQKALLMHFIQVGTSQITELRLAPFLNSPSRLVLRFSEGDHISTSAFSPDSRHFAVLYVKKRAQTTENYLLIGDADGQSIQYFPLKSETDNIDYFQNPTSIEWSPNGQYIQINVNARESKNIHLWDVANSVLLPKITTNALNSFRWWMLWSPVGHHFVIEEIKDGTDYFVVKTVAGDRLVVYPAADIWTYMNISWAPNGRAFAVIGDNQRLVGLFTLTGQAYLTDTNEIHYFGAWSKDSQRLALFTEITEGENTLKAVHFNWQTFDLSSGVFRLIRENIAPYLIRLWADDYLKVFTTTLFFSEAQAQNESYQYIADADGQAIQRINEPLDKLDMWKASRGGRYLFGQPEGKAVIVLIDIVTHHVYRIPLETASDNVIWHHYPKRLVFLNFYPPNEYSIALLDPETSHKREVARFKEDAPNVQLSIVNYFNGSVVTSVESESSLWAPDFSKRVRFNRHTRLIRIEDAQGKLLSERVWRIATAPTFAWVRC